ncbi:putative ankyrin repeat protein RF_0381 [Mya arenaria]|uniref:putative ankyrin repeat protein RF_0381 n=1 Tax=Mya arenaria TaxID=6604 RepID=UPI0022DFEFB2|nr:putative ankyrin repeat protein RF_0381 [Mya arenaria]XP_052782657.1 putative ankyrin repeat protein RF_0381 [Mya arenaria]XP_052782658.1 putative ankyrin repeat protein RF_0381 [Mya arenaria]
MDAKMYQAVQSDEPATLRRLIDRGGDVDEYYQDMTLISAKSILHMCCEKGRYECAKVLLEKGADVLIRDTWYQTPLMYSILTQYENIAALLLDHNPEAIDIGDKYGKTALHIAVEGGSAECVQLLLRYGADVNVTNNYGVTPLISVCGDKSLDADVTLQIVQMLLAAGADPNMRDYRENRNALQRATMTKHIPVIEALLTAGSDLNTLDSAGRCTVTNLLWYHHSIDLAGDVDDDVMVIVIMLIQAGANLNLHKYEQSNALCMATLFRCAPLVNYFLCNGASQNGDFWCGVTPLQIATRNKDTRTAKLLLRWHSNLYRKGRVVRGELDYTADVFHLALDVGAFEIAILLADVGYDLSCVSYLVDWSITPTSSLLHNQVMCEYFRQRATTVQSLFRWTLLKIRSCITGHLIDRATELPLPRSLISAVQLEDILT